MGTNTFVNIYPGWVSWPATPAGPSPLVSKETTMAMRREGSDYVFSNGTYSVKVSPEGFIDVKPGDWLSKYSAAIYNNLTTWHVFYELDENGNRKKIPNPHLIKAGDTLVYWDPPQFPPGTPSPDLMPLANLEEFLKEQMKNSRLRGSRKLPLLVQVTKLVPILGAGVSTVDNIRQWENALEAYLQNIGICAIAYGCTAWGFGEEYILELPAAFTEGLKNHHDADWLIIQAKKAWYDSLTQTWLNLEEQAAHSSAAKASLQAWIMGIGGEPPSKRLTCLRLWDGLALTIPPGQRRLNFLCIYPDYPSAYAVTDPKQLLDLDQLLGK